MLLFCMIVGIGSAWGETKSVTLSNKNIVDAGEGKDAYSGWELIDEGGNIWNAYAIKKYHSNATKSNHYLQIKKYASSTAYYLQLPKLGSKITGIKLTVTNTNSSMGSGSNTATLYFSSSNSTSTIGDGVASGTGPLEVTIDASSLNLNTGYITASGAVRIWEVTVTYEDDGPAPEQPTKYNVNIDSNISGGIVSASSNTAAEGTEITLEATPNDGYKFVKWYVLDGDANEITVTDNKFTMPASDVEISASFKEAVIQKYDITWSVNGKTSTEQYAEGATITIPKVEGIGNYNFVGWVTSATVESNTAPEYVKPTIATANANYYAVFATATGSESCYKLVETLTENQTYIFVSSNAEGIAYALNGSELPTDGASQLTKPKEIAIIKYLNDKVVKTIDTDLEFKYIELGKIQVVSSPSNYLLINGNGLGMRPSNYKAYWDEKGLYGTTGSNNKRYVQLDNMCFKASTGNSRVYAYEKTEGDMSYSNYCTTVPETLIISLNSACHDEEGMVYGTYSSSKPFYVSGDIIVAEVAIVDGELLVDEYDEGDLVPANTGVMVSATDGGDYYVEVENDAEIAELAESVLGSDNCLRPSGDDGISADAMATADAYCKYYRLTMHEGTQIGYWWGAADGAAFSLAANKAYLAVPSGTSVKANLWFGGVETSISAPEALNADNGVIYNLNGQRVSSATKGIYIKNGKKYFVK